MKIAKRALIHIKLFPRRHPVLTAWLIGIGYESYAVSWFAHVHISDVAQNVSIVTVAYLIVFTVFVVSCSTGWPLAMFAWIRLKLSWKEPRALFWLPIIWMSAEYTQSFIFSLAVSGSGGRIGSYLTFGSLGYYVTGTPLVFLSRFGGLWLLSGVLVCLVLCLVQVVFVPKNRTNVAIAVCSVVVATQASWFLWKNANGPKRTIAVLQIAPGQNVETEDKSINLALASLPEHSADAVIMPEYSHYFEFSSSQDIATMRRLASTDHTFIVDSFQDRSIHPYVNYVMFRSPQNTLLNKQQKWFLAPAGEYLMYFIVGMLKATGNQKVVNSFEQSKQIAAATNREQPYIVDDVSYGSLVCSGTISPEIYRSISSRGAMILTNSASLDVLGLTQLFRDQTNQAGVLDAVANARPFLQSARGSYSYVYDHNGQPILRDTSFTTKAFEATVQTNDRNTLYTLWGDWVPWLSIGAIAIKLYDIRRPRKRKLT